MSLDLEAMFTKVQRMWLMFASNPVLPADATKFLDGTGAYTTPAGTTPADADYLVGTTNAGLSNEIVVGTSPGGELGGTWGTPTVDATHSGTSHAGVITTHEAASDPHTVYVREADANWIDLTDAGATTLHSHAGGGALTLLTMVATTSGTEKDFTIPAGAKIIHVMFDGVSTNGTQQLRIQLGDTGGIEPTGYVAESGQIATATASVLTDTTGFPLPSNLAADARSGCITLTLMDAATFLWVASGTLRCGTAIIGYVAGRKALSAELTTVRVVANGVQTFDAGQLNVSYA